VNSPVRVLFILDSFPDPHAGTERQFWLLFRNLDRQKVAPAILLLRPSEYLSRHVEEQSLKVLGVQRLLSPRGVFSVLRAAWWAKRNGYQVAHIFFNDSSIVFPLPLRMLGIRVIISRRDLGFWYTPLNLPILRFVARGVDRVVANCEAVRAAVVHNEGYQIRRVEVIYNGLSRELTAKGSLHRSDFAIGAAAKLIVIVANLRPLKRIADAVDALAQLQITVGDTHLLIVGEDRLGNDGTSHRHELQRRVDGLGIADKVHFAGKMADPMPAIALADLCILCSETEGLSNTVIEYMLAGKPVVCTDVGGNPELIENQLSGCLVPVGDVDAIAHTSAALLNDQERAASFGARARQRALAMFSAQAMVQKQTELYEQLLAAKAVA